MKYAYTAFSVFSVLFLAWAYGIDFDERGPQLASILYLAIMVGIFTLVFSKMAEE